MELTDYLPRLRKNRLTLFFYFGMRALVALAAVIFLFEGEWGASFGATLVFLLMFVPSILKQRYRLYLPFALDFSIVLFIFGTLFLGHLLRFYNTVPFWDKFLHFQSGLVLSVTGFVLIYVLNEYEVTPIELSPGFVSLFAVAFSVLFGVIWEICEFIGDNVSGGNYWQANNADTMWDLITNLVGAIIVSVIGYFWMYRHKRLPFTPLLFRWVQKVKDRTHPH